MMKQNSTQKKQKRVHKCYCCIPSEPVSASKKNLYQYFMPYFLSLCFSYGLGVYFICVGPSPCFDKLDLPLSTESEDSSLSQGAVLGTQVWLWCSQTSRIPLAHWFALSRWYHQGYQSQPILLDILYAK